MGLPMVQRLLKLGWRVRAYDIVAERIAQSGALACASAAEAARDVDMVLLNLPTNQAVEEAVFAKNGLVEALRPPQLVVDFSTIPVEACCSHGMGTGPALDVLGGAPDRRGAGRRSLSLDQRRETRARCKVRIEFVTLQDLTERRGARKDRSRKERSPSERMRRRALRSAPLRNACRRGACQSGRPRKSRAHGRSPRDRTRSHALRATPAVPRAG